LVFTDIEGSTRLLRELGEDAYRQELLQHRDCVREAFGRNGGYEVDCEGDAFFYAFVSADAAAQAVMAAMTALESGPIRIRVGVHSGSPGLDPPRYVGLDVHKAARVMAAGHGGQVLLSDATRELLADRFALRYLGEYRLKDIALPERLYQLGDGDFPPLRTLYHTNLPMPASTFLGRERELSELSELLRDSVRAHPHRPWRVGKDPARSARSGCGHRAVPRRCLVGSARATARPRTGAARGGACARRRWAGA
jgi:hypothetical protein